MIINSAHPLIEEILNYNDNNEKNKKVEQLIDLALISQNLLDGEKLTDFIKRSIEIMK
jgi:molecular chaperone HtpG